MCILYTHYKLIIYYYYYGRSRRTGTSLVRLPKVELGTKRDSFRILPGRIT